MKYIIRSDKGDYTSRLIWELQKDGDIKVIAASDLTRNILESDKVYLPSDTVYPLVRNKFDQRRKVLMDNFRNKYNFRETLAHLFPSFSYDKIAFSDLLNYKFYFDRSAKYIVKPITGFMGAGARVIDKNTDLSQIIGEIKRELSKFSELYPNIFSAEVIVEEYIEGGDEYAVDMYYDNNGEPVIINIYCHPQAKRKEYLQVLYYTNKAIFDQYYSRIIDFFRLLNKDLNVKAFPIHAEFKLNAHGDLIPVEFNPCRFGGMGLADLTYYAFNIHPVKAYFEDYKPDWNAIWEQRGQESFCWVLGYNAADLDIKNTQPNHDKFKELLPKPSRLLAYEKLNQLENPGFALAYLSVGRLSDVQKILNIEFNDCFV